MENLKPVCDFDQYECEFISAYDGDSFWVRLRRTWDFGFRMQIGGTKKVNVRLLGADTPELRDKRPDWKAAAILARDLVRKWITEKPVIFLSLDKPDKYGRALGDFQRVETGERLSDYILSHHLGVAYEGENKAVVEAAHMANIQALKKTGQI